MPSNGVERQPGELTGKWNLRRRKSTAKRLGGWATIITALGGGGGYGVMKLAEARAETVSIAKLEERTSVHDAELSDIRNDLRDVSDDIFDISKNVAILLERTGSAGVHMVPAVHQRRNRRRPDGGP